MANAADGFLFFFAFLALLCVNRHGVFSSLANVLGLLKRKK